MASGDDITVSTRHGGQKDLLCMCGQGLSVDLTLHLDNSVTFAKNITIMTTSNNNLRLTANSQPAKSVFLYSDKT